MPSFRRAKIPPLATVGSYGAVGQPLISKGAGKPPVFTPPGGYLAVASVIADGGSFLAVGLGDFAIAANEVWVFEYLLYCTGITGGLKFQITGPSSPTKVRIVTEGDTTAIGTKSNDSQTAFSTPSQAYVRGITGTVYIWGTIQNGANAGTIQLQAAEVTAGQSGSILDGSYMTKQQLA